MLTPPQYDSTQTHSKFGSKFRMLWEIFLVSLKLGLTSFGGPSAHLGYFHEVYVRRHRWLSEKAYADLIALAQFLPGPSSSQIGLAIGMTRGGLLGGIAAFLGFTLPSVILLMLFALSLTAFELPFLTGLIHGLKLVAIAIVLHALSGMAKTLTPDNTRRGIALFALIVALLWHHALAQVVIIVLTALYGLFFCNADHSDGRDSASPIKQPLNQSLNKTIAYGALALFIILLVGLPVLSHFIDNPQSGVTLFEKFYRSGALVFGGGHVVLPLLEQEFVPTGLIAHETFIAGYGATQAVPGPLFTFAAFIGTDIGGILGGMMATIAIFLPGFLLMIGVMPFSESLRRYRKARGALMAVNAAVVGLLCAAFYTLLWTSTIHSSKDVSIAALLFALIAFWRFPPWSTVCIGATFGILSEALV